MAQAAATELVITRPDDWHLHLRDGDMLARVLPDTARRFGRAIVMPNLVPPVTTAALAEAYCQRILAAVPAGLAFTPLMTLYLTDATTPAQIEAAVASDCVHGVKWYPAGATTNSDSGVTDIRRCDAALDAMQSLGLPLLLHGEVTDSSVDVFDREAEFIARHLRPLIQRFPRLRLVFEHITTRQAAEFVATAFERAGLAPLGTSGFLQPVDFVTRSIDEGRSSLARGRRSRRGARRCPRRPPSSASRPTSMRTR